MNFGLYLAYFDHGQSNSLCTCSLNTGHLFQPYIIKILPVADFIWSIIRFPMDAYFLLFLYLDFSDILFGS